MAEKQLTESAWKTFSKGKSYKDAAFVKAMQALDKSEKQPAAEQLEALDDLEKEAEALGKSAKNDKDLAGYLDDVDKALKRARKEAEKRAKEEAEAAAAEEEDDAPDVLTSKMVPLLREVRKGETRYVLIANGSKKAALMLSRKTISPARGKLLVKYLEQTGGVKFFKGTADADKGNGVLFTLQQAAGAALAKRLRQAFLDQVELRVKVRIRDADSGEVEDDGEPEEPGDEAPGSGSATAQPATTEAPRENPLRQRYEDRYGPLEKRVAEVLKRNPPDANKIRAVQGFATEKADVNDFAGALKALDMLETLVGVAEKATGIAPAGAAPAGDKAEAKPGPDSGVDPVKAFNARLAALMPKVKEAMAGGSSLASDLRGKIAEAGEAAKARNTDAAGELLDAAEELIERIEAQGRGETGYKGIVAYRASLVEFRRAATTANDQIMRLKAAIPAQLEDEADLADELADALTQMTTEMLSVVDEAIKVGDDPKNPITKSLAENIKSFHDEVMSDPLVAHVDANPFGVKVNVRELLGGALAQVRKTMPTPA